MVGSQLRERLEEIELLEDRLKEREKYIEEKERELFVKETKLELEIERGRSATLANSNSVIMEALSTLCKAPIVRKEIQRQVPRDHDDYNPRNFDTAVDEVEITEE